MECGAPAGRRRWAPHRVGGRVVTRMVQRLYAVSGRTRQGGASPAPPCGTASTARAASVLQVACRGELAHDALLLLGELLRHADRHLDQQVAGLPLLGDPLAAHAEPPP